MQIDKIITRIDLLLAMPKPPTATSALRYRGEVVVSTLSLLSVAYGPQSNHSSRFEKELETIESKSHPNNWAFWTDAAAREQLNMLRYDLENGLAGDISKTIAGGILGDFLGHAREALKESGEGPKNVAAVLAASLFEDTMRRLAALNGIGHFEKLADTINELKVQSIITGAQVPVALSYLSFRNNALHAQWDKVDRPETASVLGFTEEMLIKHFS